MPEALAYLRTSLGPLSHCSRWAIIGVNPTVTGGIVGTTRAQRNSRPALCLSRVHRAPAQWEGI